MYKARMNKLPSNVQVKFTTNIGMKYSLRSIDKFKVNFVRTSLKSWTISVFGVKVFHKLAINIVKAKNELQ